MLHLRDKPTLPGRQAPDLQRRRAAAIAGAIARRQHQAARLLSRKFELLPLQARKACLLFFVLLMGSASSWLLLQAAWPGALTRVKPQLFPHYHHRTGHPAPAGNGVSARQGPQAPEPADSLFPHHPPF